MSVKVIVIESNLSLNRRINEYLLSNKKFEVVGNAFDGKEGLELIKNNNADICILDLLLPKKDGIHILEEISKDNDIHTSFLVISSIFNDFIVEKIINFGVKYYMLKPFELKILENRIWDIQNYKTSFNNKSKSSNIDSTVIISQENIKIDSFVERCLTKAGIDSSYKGHRYLKTAIKMCINDENLLQSVTKVLYNEISLMYNTTPYCIERTIRHCILKSSEIANKNLYSNEFKTYSNCKITNRKFIHLMTQEYRLEYQEINSLSN